MAAFTFEYFFLTLSGLLILGVIFYFLYKRYVFSGSKELSLNPPLENEQGKKRWYDFLRPQIPQKIKHLKHKREHKIAEQKHRDFFAEFGKEAEKVNNIAFNKLKRVVKHHKGKEKLFQNLEEVAEKVKEKEKKLAEKKEINDSVSKLKEMFGKNEGKD